MLFSFAVFMAQHSYRYTRIQKDGSYNSFDKRFPISVAISSNQLFSAIYVPFGRVTTKSANIVMKMKPS